MFRNESQEQSWEGEIEGTPGVGALFGLEPHGGEPYGVAWAALMDEFAFGLAIVDRGRRLLHANRAADAEFRHACCLRVNREVVEAVSPFELARFQQAVEDAECGRRSYLALGGHGAKTEIAFLPVADSDFRGQACAALVFERRPGVSGLGLYFFAQVYRLTRGEQRVLSALSEGLSVAEAGTHIGCAVNTVRTHVRNLLAKTGQRNLRALIGRLGLLPPVASRLGFGRPARVGVSENWMPCLPRIQSRSGTGVPVAQIS